MGDESEWLKLPTEEKVQHKAWKARLTGYEEATKLFQTQMNEKSPEFSKYLGLVKKFVVDSNAIAQEKGLEAVLAFVENAHVAGKTTAEVCGGVVTKCLNASRAKTKERGLEILLMYVEIEKQEMVQDELIKGLSNKQPKIVAGCVQALRTALRDFGSKVILIKPLVKLMQKLLEDRDKNVREETKQLVVEMYRWAGPALKPQMASFKPVLLSELEAEFEKLPPEKPIQSRFLRSQQDLKAKLEAEAAASAAAGDTGDVEGDEGPGDADVMDPYDLMDPVEILSKLPKDYYEKIEAKKWQERKEVLEAAQKLAENLKLEPGDYHDLVKTLKKVVAKDTNVMLVTVAAKTIGGLARGLRGKFSTYAPGCVDVLLEKFREKKITVVTALREAIDAVFLTTTLDPISESCVAALEHKTPTVRMETSSFLARCFSQCTMQTLPKKLLKLFVAPLLKLVSDSAGDVREASFQALGTAMKVVGEKPLIPFLSEVDNLKMAKIKECCEKAEVVGKAAKPAGGAAPAAAAGPKAAPAPASKRPATAPGKPAAKQPAPGVEDGSAASGSRPPAIKGGKKKPAAAARGKKPGVGPAKDEVTENVLSDEAVEEKVGAILPAGCIAGLASSNWKERLASMEKFTEVIKGMGKDEIPCQACVRMIARKPGLKETNFQVLKLKVDLVSHLALNSKFTKRSAESCLQELVDKVGDVKNGGSVKETLSCISEACGLEFVSMEVVKMAFEQKNPKNQSEALVWLAQAVREFGFKVTVKPMISYIKKAFAATNPAIRTSAITLVGVLHMYMGPVLRTLFEDEKPALLQQIDAEVDKVKGEKPPAPTRGLTAQEKAAADDADEEEDDADGGGVNVADLVPRNDISEKITDSLVAELADKNWKIRNEALQSVVAILNEAKFITPNIGPLPEALKLRLADSNKILVKTTLVICQTLATAMGPNIRKHVPTVGPGLLSSLGDSKPQLRTQAISTLNAWVDQGGLQVFVEGEILFDALKLENPNLRSTLLGWLAERLPATKKLPADLKDSIPILFKCLEDRNADVRKSAQACILPFMIHTGFESMAKQATKLKGSSKDQAVTLLEKAKGELPAKPKKTVVAAAVSKVTPVAVEHDTVDYDEPAERPTTAGSKTGGARAKGKLGAKKPTPATSSRKKVEEEDLGPPLKASNGKEQRFKDERARKVLKWNFTTPQPEFLEQLKAQMEPTFSKTLMEQLFHNDFKHHIKAMETLQKLCEAGLEETIANFDLILKWLTLRFFDTNTSVLLKALEYQQVVFALLAEEDYHMQELEATSFVPYLVNKVGDPKDNVRRNVRDIFNRICKVYPASKMFSFIIEGIKSKNSKQRAECLEELGCQIEVYGINVCQPSPAQALKIIAQQIGDRDKTVRSAALNTIVAAYAILGETVYKYVGHLNDKDMSYLEERIKRSAKTRPQPPAAPRLSPEERPKAVPSQVQRPVGGGQRLLQRQAYRAKREFELDIDDNESMVNYDMPDLVQHDLEDILDEPVELPKTRMRPPSPSVKLIGSSSDAKSAIDLVISQVASNDIITCLTALNQIDMVLKDDNKWEMLTEHVDQLLVVCSLQSRMTYSKHTSDESFQDNVIKLYRAIMGSLLAVFECQDLGKSATRDILKDLLFNLVTILLDSRLESFEDGPQVVRSVNVLVVRIVEKGDSTNVMSALIKLLHETVAVKGPSVKFLELIMKCLWKLIRMLPNIVNDLNIDRILGDIHHFLKAFPSNTWKSRPNDTPLRTVKTVLHSLVKLKGNKIMSHLSLVDDHSEVEAYIEKVLRNGMDQRGLAVTVSRNDQVNGTEVVMRARKESSPRSSSKRISKTTHDMLAEIFKKIGSKENTREGLNDLFDFKQKHPDADLDPFLKKSSEFFQNYIQRGLRNIELERDGKMKQSSSAPLMTTSSSSVSLSSNGSADPGDSEINPSVYMEKLKVLRARCGLDNNKPGLPPGSEASRSEPGGGPGAVSFSLNGSNSSLSSNSSGGGGGGGGLGALGSSNPPQRTSDSMEQAEQENSASVADLKRRLEKIKSAARN